MFTDSEDSGEPISLIIVVSWYISILVRVRMYYSISKYRDILVRVRMYYSISKYRGILVRVTMYYSISIFFYKCKAVVY